MINNYNLRRPQSFIYQNKEVVLDGETTRDNAFLFGPCVYTSDLENDPANINVFNKTELASGAKILLRGTPSSLTDDDVPVFKNGGLQGYKNSDGKWIYIIPNSNLYNLLSKEVKDLNDADKYLWKLDKDSVEAVTYDSLKKNAPQTVSSADAKEITFTDTGSNITKNFIIKLKATRMDIQGYDIERITSIADIKATLGPIVESNPLAFAANLALEAGQKAIYVESIYSEDSDGAVSLTTQYENVLTKISHTDIVQFLVPVFGDKLYDDKTVNTAFTTITNKIQEHVNQMSNESKKKWRRAYIGCPYMTGIESKTTTDAVKDAIVELANQLSLDRMILVWTNNAKYLDENGAAKIMQNDYLAAYVAGIRAAALPQQGLSRREIDVISSIPSMYTSWSEELLDDLAAQGVFIITQDYKNSPVYIRHQLTTEVKKGILYWEDSVGVNVDDISYMAKDLVEPYIGTRNATPLTLDEINNKWYAALLEKTNANEIGTFNGADLDAAKIGPQIINIVDGSVTTKLHPTFKDRVVMTATLEIPLPLNTIVVYINAIQSLA